MAEQSQAGGSNSVRERAVAAVVQFLVSPEFGLSEDEQRDGERIVDLVLEVVERNPEVVTDEMVKRAWKGWGRRHGNAYTDQRMREALEAAFR